MRSKNEQEAVLVLNRRRALAVFFVAALFAAVGIACAAEKLMNKNARIGEQDLMYGLLESEEILANGEMMPDLVLGRMEKALSRWKGPLPVDFASEIGVLEGASEMYVYEERGIVGYGMAGDAGAIREMISGSMRERGWRELPLGGVDGATYVKTEGRYTWALITETQIGESVSVVVRYMGKGGDDR